MLHNIKPVQMDKSLSSVYKGNKNSLNEADKLLKPQEP